MMKSIILPEFMKRWKVIAGWAMFSLRSTKISRLWLRRWQKTFLPALLDYLIFQFQDCLPCVTLFCRLLGLFCFTRYFTALPLQKKSPLGRLFFSTLFL